MEPNDHDIETLISMSADGDSVSCKKLYDHLVDRVYAFVQYRTSTHEQAIDITQDIFIDLFAALKNFTYQSRAQFYAYVFVITRRKLAKHYDNKQKRGEDQTASFDEDHMSPLSASDEVTTADRLDVDRALTTVDEVTREIIVLHHWSRYTFGEIALLLNLTESNVRVRHHRALKTLAGQLKN